MPAHRFRSPIPAPGRAPFLRLALCLIAIAALLPACSGGDKAAATGPRPVAVVTAVAERQNVPVEIRAVGVVQPLATVEVTPRVGGMIIKQMVVDGQYVHEGDPLFEIDRRPLLAVVQGARAELARNVALQEKAQKDLNRYIGLARQRAVSEESLEKARTDLATQSATVDMDHASLQQAQLKLEYADIRAPISGRAGKVLVQQGNVITADDQSLLVINQMAPIAVDFSVPEKNLPQILERFRKAQLTVQAAPDGSSVSSEGVLASVDNAVDQSTGSIGLRAVFDNAEGVLWPGQFVRVLLRVTTLDDAVIVPSQAVNIGIDGPYVYVITPGHTAEYKTVTLGPVQGRLTVIAKGLSGGETVVTEGHLRLKPGSPVAVAAPGADKG